MRIPRPPLHLVISWVALCLLLALTVTLAYEPLGNFNTPIALTIATTKGLIVALIFMELRTSRPLTRFAAAAGLGWFVILLWLTWTDFSSRSYFPPVLPSQLQGTINSQR
jgi:cytochrome c oxidase subunit 4